jgi:hypothetical protein
VLAILGLEPSDLRCTDDDLRNAGAARILAAAAAALGVGPELTGRASPVAIARAATIQLGRAANISRRELGWATRLTGQRIGQLLRTAVDRETLEAVRRRLALENAVRARRAVAA